MILIIISVVIIICVLLWISKNKSQDSENQTLADYFTPGVDHDTIYYMITDVNGVKSIIHDSGLKPSSFTAKSEKSDNLTISVVKNEYNDGKLTVIGYPLKINFGCSVFNLENEIRISSDDIQDKKDLYIIKIPNLWKSQE